MTTILVAEDNRVNQRLLTFTLQKSGHRVITALHGGEALAQLAVNSIDLVIADINMPEMDGVTFVKRVRADERFRALPVIVLTASGKDEDYEMAWAAGANDVLTKPTSSHELIATIEKMLHP